MDHSDIRNGNKGNRAMREGYTPPSALAYNMIFTIMIY